MHWAVKLALFAISAIAFFAVFGFVIDTSWLTVLLLLLAVAFHELGHLAGMWIFGYRDLQILFIPAFGAMTTGIKTQAPPWQRAVVAFLGPMPGLILSCALLLTLQPPEDSWQFQLFVIMLVLNYINLFPLLPLDGGAIVEVAIAHRLPYTTTLMTLISALAFGVAGVYLRDAILLILAGALLIVLRSQWRVAKAQKALSQEIPEGDGDELLHRIFAELSKPQYSRLTFGTRVAFARKFLSHRKNGSAGLLLAGTCLAVQIITLAIPLLVWVTLVRE